MTDRPRYYYLVGTLAVPVPHDDVRLWARSFERAERVLKQEYVGDLMVSTVFLGMDHNFLGDGPPLIFETMVFGSSWTEQDTERYSTWLEAMQGHRMMCEKVRKSMTPMRLFFAPFTVLLRRLNRWMHTTWVWRWARLVLLRKRLKGFAELLKALSK